MTMPSFLIAAAKWGALEIILVIAAGVLALPTLVIVHRGWEYCYLKHARRFCRKHGYELVRWRCEPEFDKSGIKTEFTVFELDCVDGQGQRRLVRLLVWVFGVRKMLSDENYPESSDEKPSSA